MSISETNRKILEERGVRFGPPMSDTNREILEQRQKDFRLASIPGPDLGVTSNSTDAVNLDERSSLSKVALGGVLGGARLKDYGTVAKDLVQGTVRGGFASGVVLAGAATGKTPTEVAEFSYMPQGLAKIWLSDQAVGSASEGSDILIEFGVSENVAVNMAPGILVGLTALDTATGGGKGKGLKALITGLKNSDTVEDAAFLMKSAGYSDDIITDYAPLFAKTKDADEIAKALNASSNLQNTTKMVESAPPVPLKSADVVTVEGNALSDVVSSFKQLFKDAVRETGIVVEEGSKSVSDYRAYVKEIADNGRDVTDLKASLDEISATMKVEPERFVAKDKIDYANRAEDVKRSDQDIYDEMVGNTPKVEAATPKVSDEVAPVKVSDFKTADDVPDDILEKADFSQPETFKKGDKLVHSYENDIGFGKSETQRKFVTVGAVSAKTGGIRLDTKLPGGKIQSNWYDARSNSGGSKTTIYKITPDLPKKQAAEFAEARKLDEVADPVKNDMGPIAYDIQNRYGKTAVTGRNVEQVKKAERETYNEIFTYSQEAVFLAKNGGEITRSMPSWVPDHLKDLKIFDELLQILGKGEIPKVHGGPHMELYTAMVDEAAKRAGVVAKRALPAIDGKGALLQSMRQGLKTPNETLALRESFSQSPLPPAKESKVSFEKVESPDDFEAWRQKTGEAGRLSMPKADPEDIKWLDDAELNFTDDVKMTKVGKFTAYLNDVFAISEKVLGDSWQTVKVNVFDKFDAAKGRYAREEMDLKTRLKVEILDKYKIKRKSKESAHIMDYGEGKMTYGQLVREYGKPRADELVEATDWFRMMYDEMIEQINLTRPEGRKIAHRGKADENGQGGYFRHFQEMSNFGQLINNFENPSLGNLDNAGLKETWARRFSFTKQRKGDRSTRDAIGGFLDYIPQYSYEKNINPEIPKITAFIEHLKREGGGAAENYANFLGAWANDLAFGYNPVDAGLDFIPGGRRAIEVGNWFNNRVKRNAVLGNVGTAFAQAFTLPNLSSEAGLKNMLHGMGMYKLDAFTENALWKQSDFLMERFMNSADRAFAVGFWEKTTNKTGFMISALDQAAATSGWYALLAKAESMGLEGAAAIKYADDKTRQMVGGRGIGEVAIMQKSKLFQIAAPFTLEAVKTLQLAGVRIAKGDGDKFVHWLAATYIMNEGIEKVTGQRVSMDPVNAFLDIREIQNDTNEDKGVRMVSRGAGEIVSSLPLGKYAVAGYQYGADLDDKERKEQFGDGDPLRYGGRSLLENAITPGFQAIFSQDEELTDKDRAALAFESFLRIGLPQGGNQIRKTISGLLHLSQEEENRDPQTRPGALGDAQNVFFGKWSPNIQYEESLDEKARKDYLTDKIFMDGDDEEKKKAIKEAWNEKSDDQKERYKAAAKDEREKEEYRQIQEMRPLYRQVAALNANGHRDMAKAVYEELTEKEKEIFKIVRTEEEEDSKRIAEGVEANPESLLREILDYGYAIGTNPIQSFKHIFNGQHIEGVVGGSFGGMVIVRRMPHMEKGGSDEVKKRWMEEQGIEDSSTVSLEHKLPLSLGGNNTLENLELVPKVLHDSWTAMEVRLNRAVKAKRINYVDAQELILRYKGYEGEPITEKQINQIIGEGPIGDDEIIPNIMDKLGDTRYLSDQDYATRKDPITGREQGRRTDEHEERDKLLEATK